VRKTFWSELTTWEEVKRRAGGRAKYNALRQFGAAMRRRQVLHLLGELGWTYGVQATMARRLGVSEATISRDMAQLLPLVKPCPACGQFILREWWAE
jgi:hypothetical protein